MAGPHWRSRLRRIATRAAVVVAACVLVPITCLYVIQDRFVFAPDTEVPAIASVLPGGQEVTFSAADGTVEHAWFVPARGDATGVTLVAFHGYNGNRASMAENGTQLAAGGVAVLLAEYRGYGDVDGQPSEDGLRQDAIAASTYVRSRPGVDASKIVLLGYSLGTGVAVEAAEAQPPAALVLMAPYTSLPDVAWSRMPGLPYRLLMHTRFDSRTNIAGVHVPLLVIRGSDDHMVLPEQSRSVFDAANEPKRLVTIVGADHDLRGPNGPAPMATVLSFLRDAIPEG